MPIFFEYGSKGNKNILVSFLIIFFIGYSCHDTSTPIDSFFHKLEKCVDKNKLLTFKNASNDSASFYFYQFSDEVMKVYEDSSQITVLNNFFEKIHITNQLDARIDYLCFAFHAKLNNRSFNNDYIVKCIEAKNLLYEESLALQQIKSKLESYEILHQNDLKHGLSDTISLLLPVRLFDNNEKSAVYANNFSESFNYSNYDDSLRVVGKIIKKDYYYAISGKKDTTDIIFNLKILSLNKPECKIFYEKFEIGDTIKISILAYGRPII